ncbi:hypothetical protein [Candidatus Marithrix sp. Canyon 246]|uniref:hypothetical protein n=1 Tax=Candidatus Marithrix sp. Canyon 246 TaxID=1827136 RepID=UPI000849F0C4|nr:hypothetical protein [Candidatus Marithrix sp. Canyon 246]
MGNSAIAEASDGEILSMQHCEFNRLIKWIEDIFHLITRLTNNPTDKIAYSLHPYPESQCPRISDKGRNIQLLRL